MACIIPTTISSKFFAIAITRNEWPTMLKRSSHDQSKEVSWMMLIH